MPQLQSGQNPGPKKLDPEYTPLILDSIRRIIRDRDPSIEISQEQGLSLPTLEALYDCFLNMNCPVTLNPIKDGTEDNGFSIVVEHFTVQNPHSATIIPFHHSVNLKDYTRPRLFGGVRRLPDGTVVSQDKIISKISLNSFNQIGFNNLQALAFALQEYYGVRVSAEVFAGIPPAALELAKTQNFEENRDESLARMWAAPTGAAPTGAATPPGDLFDRYMVIDPRVGLRPIERRNVPIM